MQASLSLEADGSRVTVFLGHHHLSFALHRAISDLDPGCPNPPARHHRPRGNPLPRMDGITLPQYNPPPSYVSTTSLP